MNLALLGFVAVASASPAFAHAGPLTHSHGADGVTLALTALGYMAVFFPIGAVGYVLIRKARL